MRKGMRIVFPDLIYVSVVFAEPAHSTFKGPRIVNSADIAEWLVSPGVRLRYLQGGAMVLDLRGHYYTLNGFAAQVWATIETNLSGTTVEDILGVLETHFDVPRGTGKRCRSMCGGSANGGLGWGESGRQR
jgi:hypothetical protein